MLFFSLTFISSFREGCRTDFFGKSRRSLHRWISTRLTGRSPVTLPPGLGISTSGLNFADSKITAPSTDGICIAEQHINVSDQSYNCPNGARCETGVLIVYRRQKKEDINRRERRAGAICVAERQAIGIIAGQRR